MKEYFADRKRAGIGRKAAAPKTKREAAEAKSKPVAPMAKKVTGKRTSKRAIAAKSKPRRGKKAKTKPAQGKRRR